jgi:hypothetical protein
MLQYFSAGRAIWSLPTVFPSLRAHEPNPAARAVHRDPAGFRISRDPVHLRLLPHPVVEMGNDGVRQQTSHSTSCDAVNT